MSTKGNLTKRAAPTSRTISETHEGWSLRDLRTFVGLTAHVPEDTCVQIASRPEWREDWDGTVDTISVTFNRTVRPFKTRPFEPNERERIEGNIHDPYLVDL